MLNALYYLFLVVLLAVAVFGGIVAIRAYINGTTPLAGFFGPKPEHRLDVVEQSNVDGRRRLLLIRRDDVEHLIMTGGPIDLVIETGIKHERPVLAAVEPETDDVRSVFSRPPRSFGPVAGEG
jgi:hypothetical protein